MTEELTPTATDWPAIRFERRKDAITERWHGVQRRTLAEAWDIGHGLRAVKDEMQHGEWLPWLAEIGMGKDTAARFMRLAERVQISQLAKFASVDDALKALPPARPKPEATIPKPEPEPLTGDVMSEAEAEDAMNEAAAEADTADADREERAERLAVRLENADGDAVDALGDQLDKADERHRDDVQSVNDARKAETVARRKNREVRDALLAVPRDGDAQAAVDDVLATFFSVQRK